MDCSLIRIALSNILLVVARIPKHKKPPHRTLSFKCFLFQIPSSGCAGSPELGRPHLAHRLLRQICPLPQPKRRQDCRVYVRQTNALGILDASQEVENQRNVCAHRNESNHDHLKVAKVELPVIVVCQIPQEPRFVSGGLLRGLRGSELALGYPLRSAISKSTHAGKQKKVLGDFYATDEIPTGPGNAKPQSSNVSCYQREEPHGNLKPRVAVAVVS